MSSSFDADARHMAAIIASAMDAIITVDADQRIVLFNRAAERVFGVRADEVMGEPLDRFIPGRFRALHHDYVTEFGRTGETTRRMGRLAHGRGVRALRGDGSEFPIDAAISHAETPEGRVYTVILRDIGEEVAAEEERERLIAELDDERRRLATLAAESLAASHAKTAFLATMSHELRTPLNAILGYTELMELGLAGPATDQQRAYHERVRQSARHLLGLISDVLDVSRVEAGKLRVQRERVTLQREAAAALALVRPQAAARRLRLGDRASCDADLKACGDAGRVRQVLANLLSNAVKFTPEGGTVVVECGRSEERAWVRVVDTGIGVPASQVDAVFEPFVQATDEATGPYRRTQGGSGLGLAISRQLARLMGGDLTLESTAGVGSTFTLWLPLWEPVGGRGVAPAVAAGESTPRHVRLALGETLAACADQITKTWADRLRADLEVPQARDCAHADVENHVGAFLADFAQHFTILDDPTTADRMALMRDGVHIQNTIAQLHGIQRARLGWTESAMLRELTLLGEEVERRLREELGEAPGIEDSIALVRTLLRSAGRQAMEAFRGSRGRRDAA